MFKVYLKSSELVLEKHLYYKPEDALDCWNNLRVKNQEKYILLPVTLNAAWSNQDFLTHRFNSHPDSAEFIKEGVDLLPLFAAAMLVGMGNCAGSPLIGDRIDYSQVDWSKKNAELARLYGVSRQTIAAQRRRHAPDQY